MVTFENMQQRIMRAMNTLAERLKFARKRCKLNQDQLAELSGIGQGVISKIERGSIKKTTGIVALARALDCNPFWLETGEDQPGESEGQQIKRGNVDVARAFTGEVPVISWVQAGAWHEVAEAFQPDDAERYLPIFKGHSSQTYALKVRGDSMTSPHGKSYPQGSYIIVDPAKVSPNNGDRIIAKLEGSAEVTFKVYKDEDGRKWLAPLNTSHQPIIEPFKVLGTVIGKWEDE
jgi:SOS-response transcriptional repressor LexA